MSREPIALTDRDRTLLLALAEQRLAVLPQAAVWLGVSEAAAAKRLRRLRDGGLVEFRRVFSRGAPMARITGDGLERVGSRLAAPGQKLDEYRHDVGVGWVWTAAREGALGPMAQIVSERGMRSHDGRLDRMTPGERASCGQRLLAVDLGLPVSDARGGRHYPDLLMRTRAGNTLAVELELSTKGRRRLDRVMDAYAADRRIDRVLYLVPDARMARTIAGAAERAGIGDRVHIRQLAPGQIAGVADVPTTTRSTARARARDAVSR